MRNSYTMEATFCGSLLGKQSGHHFNTADLETIGQHLCDSTVTLTEPRWACPVGVSIWLFVCVQYVCMLAWMCVHLCMWQSMFVYACGCMRMCMCVHAGGSECMCMCVYVCGCECMCVCMRVSVNVCVCMFVCECMCMCVYACV